MRKLISIVFAFTLAVVISAESNQASALETPNIFNAKNIGGGSVQLEWTQVPGATYQVKYGPANNPKAHGLVTGEGTNATINALFQNSTWVFSVKAVRGSDVSSDSNSVRVRIGSSGRSRHKSQTTTKQALVGQRLNGKIVTPAVFHNPSTDTMRSTAGLNDPHISTGKSGVGHLNLRTVTGPTKGQITLFWNQPQVANAGDFNIIYTDNPTVEKWGVLNIPGNNRSFTVSALPSGKRIWFKMSSTNTGNTPWVSDIAR